MNNTILERPVFISIKKAAEILGFNHRKVWELVRDNKIKSIVMTIGTDGRVRRVIKTSDLDKYISAIAEEQGLINKSNTNDTRQINSNQSLNEIFRELRNNNK